LRASLALLTKDECSIYITDTLVHAFSHAIKFVSAILPFNSSALILLYYELGIKKKRTSDDRFNDNRKIVSTGKNKVTLLIMFIRMIQFKWV
jgi:hypothetical protein